MNLFSFTANFGSEETYGLHFKEERDKQGVECKYGSGAVGKQNVAIIAESTVLEVIETEKRSS